MHLMPPFRLRYLASLAVLLLAACGGERAPATEETDPGIDTTAVLAGQSGTTPDSLGGAAKLNVNTATREQLLAIPGSSERMAHEFEEYRPYVSIRQFRREIGKYVDAEQVSAYEQHLYVPVDPNESDAETLQQLPGVDAAKAQELVAGRPYASRQAFLDRLRATVTPAQAAQAEQYLAAE